MNAKRRRPDRRGPAVRRAGPAAVDRWAAPTYVQHSSLAADGADGLRSLVENLPAGFRYDLHRVIADGNLVALHGTYHGFGPAPLWPSISSGWKLSGHRRRDGRRAV